MDLNKDFVLAIKDSGQEIIDKAEVIGGSSDGLLKLSITIEFDASEYTMFSPTIKVVKEYTCMNSIERLNKGE